MTLQATIDSDHGPSTTQAIRPIDLNKIYEPIGGTKTLKQLANEIGHLYAAGKDLRLALIVRLHDAKKLVDAREGTNLSWEEWCTAHIRKPDGSQYTPKTISRMIRMARAADPQKTLARHRAMTRRYNSNTIYLHTRGRLQGVVARAPSQAKIDEIKALTERGLKNAEISKIFGCNDKTIRNIRSGRTKSKEFWAERARQDTISGQVQQFLAHWERMEPEARRQALHAINARFLP